MQLNLDEKKNFLINFVYFAVWFIIVYLLLKVAAIYLLPFLIGVFIAYCVQKPSELISSKIKISKQICAAILSFFVYIFVIGIFCLLVWLLYTNLNTLIKYFSRHSDTIRRYAENFYLYFDNFFENTEIGMQNTIKKLTDDTLNSFIEKISSFLSKTVTSIIKNLPNLLISCIVTVVATCYISKDFERLKKFIKGVIGVNLCKKIVEIKNIFTECFLKLVIGYFWLFIITFTELFLGLMLLGVKRFFTFALLIATLDALPVIGTGAVLLPWSVVNFFQSNYKLGIGLVVLYVLIAVVKNFLEPKIIGKQIGINPLFTLLFIFLGLRVGGVFGMLVFPIVLTVLFTYYRRKFFTEQHLK